MANSRSGWGGFCSASLSLLAACASAPPVAEPPRRPVEHVVVAARFNPHVEWTVTADSNLSGRTSQGGGVAKGILYAGVVCGPFMAVCLAVALPVAAVGVGIESAVAGNRARSAGKGADQGSGVRQIDLSSLGSALDLQSRLEKAVGSAGWRVQPEGNTPALRLEAQVERMKALSGTPIRNLWVHELDTSWRLVNPADSSAVASGRFSYEKVLSFSLRHDEATGRWVSEDDGRFAIEWARACEEIAARIVREAAPAIAAYRG
jgi:hypothetical protein